VTTPTNSPPLRPARRARAPVLSLYQLLDPAVLADPYELYDKLRAEAPVLWDPYLHAWVVTRYADVVTVLHRFSAERTPTPEQFEAMGLGMLTPLAAVMVKQMLFLDGKAHGRLRQLAAHAFTPARVEMLRGRIATIVEGLLDKVQEAGTMDVIADLAYPLPAIVTAELLGVPSTDCDKLKAWSEDFAQVLGNFQHNPDYVPQVLRSLEEMSAYFHDAVRDQRANPREGLVSALLAAEVDGDRLDEEEIVANLIVTMVGGQETTTNLIGNGMLTLLRRPEALRFLAGHPEHMATAVEELLRYESPSQHTARIAREDTLLGGKVIQKGQAVIAVVGAANRDPAQFPDPHTLDLTRQPNRHVAFGWAAHFCFGAPLARLEGRTAFETLLRRMPALALGPEPLVWRDNLGLRGLTALPVSF